jgi:hypothetical protein
VNFADLNWEKLFALTAIILLTGLLGGCAETTTRSSLMSALDEMTTGSTKSKYLPVGDLPQSHQELMTADEEAKARKELIAAQHEAALKAAQQQRNIDAWLRSRAILPAKH